MSAAISRGLDLLRAGVAELDADVLDGAQARALVEQCAEIVRLGEAGMAFGVRRVRETAAWAHVGYHRDAAAWLASVSGSSVGAARATLEAADGLSELPATADAMRAGKLSAARAQHVVAAATMDPSAERDLLLSASRDGMKTLKERCSRVRAAAQHDQMAAYERIYRVRSLRHWEDPDGTGRIDIRGPLDATARIMARLAPYEREMFESARKRGKEYERSDAYAFDALVAMADASSGARAPARSGDTSLVVRVDLDALRGWTEPGEVCEIVGVGPIPVPVALRMAKGAFIKAVVTDGIDVHSVVHIGRKPPAVLETALAELYSQCVKEGCDATRHLEIDHNEPWSEGGPTRLSNLNPVCKYDHREKHRRNLRIVGEGTSKRFVAAAAWSGPDPPRRT